MVKKRGIQTKIPQPTPRKFGGKTFVLHASYSTEKEALEAKQELRFRGYNVRIVKVRYRWYRVYKRRV